MKDTGRPIVGDAGQAPRQGSLVLLAARQVVLDTHVIRYFSCVGWEPHLRLAFAGRLHLADAVARELKDQRRRVPSINAFFAAPLYWERRYAEDDELITVTDLQRDWEAKHGFTSRDDFRNLGEAESLAICIRPRPMSEGWVFVTNDHDAAELARALKILVANPFSVVALLFHQGYLTSGESWLGYQSMVQAHGMRGADPGDRPCRWADRISKRVSRRQVPTGNRESTPVRQEEAFVAAYCRAASARLVQPAAWASLSPTRKAAVRRQ